MLHGGSPNFFIFLSPQFQKGALNLMNDTIKLAEAGM